MAIARIEQNINTSSDVGGQGDKLSETLSGEVLAELVLLAGIVVDVSYHQGVFLGIDEVLQEMNCPEQRLVVRAVDGDYVQFSHGDLGQLDVGLSKLVDSSYLYLFPDIHCQPFSTSHTCEVSCEPLQLIATIFLLTILQPCLL